MGVEQTEKEQAGPGVGGPGVEKKRKHPHEAVLGVLQESEKLGQEFPEGTGGESRQRQYLPISIRLVNPGRAGLFLGPFPRLGALDDHCLYPPTRDLRLNERK